MAERRFVGPIPAKQGLRPDPQLRFRSERLKEERDSALASLEEVERREAKLREELTEQDGTWQTVQEMVGLNVAMGLTAIQNSELSTLADRSRKRARQALATSDKEQVHE